MTLRQALNRARETLSANGIEESSLQSELLLRHSLEVDRVKLYLALDEEISPEQYQKFWGLVERCLDGEPVAYIVGHREFYGLDFHVDPAVLIPRPESELLVERALKLAQPHRSVTIAEVGTGCGAIAISLALSRPQSKIYATDISAAALRVARLNCQKHGVLDRIYLLEGDLLQPLPEPVDLVVANLPYVRASELKQVKALNAEPSLALNGGRDGLEKIRRLGTEIRDRLRPGGRLLLEVGEGQSQAVTSFLGGLFPSAVIEVTKDLSGIDRVVSLTLPPARRSAVEAEKSGKGTSEAHIKGRPNLTQGLFDAKLFRRVLTTKPASQIHK